MITQVPEALKDLPLHKVIDKAHLMAHNPQKGDLVWLRQQKTLKLWDGRQLVSLALKTRHDR